jgi:hypothetical protein
MFHIQESDLEDAGLTVFAIRVATGATEIAACLDDDGIKAVAGYRVSEWLHAGKYLEIEDLVTRARYAPGDMAARCSTGSRMRQ